MKKASTAPVPTGADAEKPYAEREDFFDAAREYTGIVAAETELGTFFVGTEDRKLGRNLFARGVRSELATMATALNVVDERAPATAAASRRGTFLDVGANIGTSVVSALLLHDFTAGVALEPAPENYRLLRLNLIANHLEDRVRPLFCAASNSDGVGHLELSAGNWGNHQLVESDDGEARDGSLTIVDVDQRSLDSLAEEGELDPDEVSLVWIDAQGHEGHILEGAASITERGIPIVQEFHPELLARADGMERLRRIVHEHYSHVADLRSSTPQLMPVSDDPLGQLIDRYPPSSSKRFTDVLLVSGVSQAPPKRHDSRVVRRIRGGR